MSKDYISFTEYTRLMCKCAGWLVLNQKSFKKRDIYGYMARSADRGTIEKTAKERYEKKDYQPDSLVAEYVECAIHDNTDLSFLPNYIVGSDGTKYFKQTFVDMARRVSEYEVKNGRSPAIVYLTGNTIVQNTTNNSGDYKSPYDSHPHPTGSCCNQRGQNTPYYCAPSSIHKILYKFGIRNFTQGDLARFMGTTTAGTGHAGIETGIATVSRRTGVKLSIKWVNFSDLGWDGLGKIIANPNKDVICHNLYRNQYGHYEVFSNINTSTQICKIINSLGSKCNNGCYEGYLENRKFSTHRSYMNGISQKSIGIVTKG